jgi:hypothetical protein
MRWRIGLMGFSLIGGSCLEVGVLDPSILKTERPPVTRVRSNDYCADAMRRRTLPRERVRSLAQMRSADRIERRLCSEAKRKTSTLDEYFAL